MSFFGMVISNICVFLQRSIYPRTAAASSSVMMVMATLYKLFLKVPWVNKQLACFHFQEEIKGHWCKI